MENDNEIDVRDLCRICAAGSGKDALYPLIDGDVVTELGELFEICIGLQLRREGFPDRLCNYCQLQLNTFHAFLKRAETSNKTFEEILNSVEEAALEDDVKDQYIEMHGLDENSEGELDYMIDNNTNKSPKIEQTDVTYLSQQNLVSHEILVADEISAAGELEHTEHTDDENDGNESFCSVEYLEMDEFGTTYEDDVDIDGNRKDDMENDESIGIDGTTSMTTSSSTKSTTAKRATGTKSKRSYPFRCKKCARRFMYKEVYDAHMRVHKGLPAFACPHCPKTFSEKANFDYHMQDHTNYRPAKCTMCEKSFKNKQDLASHIRCHKDIRKYMCDVCGKRFRSQSHMVYHRYSHFEERNFHCDLCTQSFKSPHILRTHRNTVHSKIFRYECEECGRKFKRDHHLIAHRGVHLRAKMKNIKKEIQEPTELN